ncbi:hypothetical protein WA026_008993 [Henosepilachna vigintioctopunctata]|uniref:Uncharacterized protein n=1 Tax=Henosepilachna vigintioctopunctata TaxID=420089 RepID=A0AAW1VD99_9CUCU
MDVIFCRHDVNFKRSKQTSPIIPILHIIATLLEPDVDNESYRTNVTKICRHCYFEGPISNSKLTAARYSTSVSFFPAITPIVVCIESHDVFDVQRYGPRYVVFYGIAFGNASREV